MTVSYSTLLKLNNIVTGTEEGTWGDITNTNICTLIEQAIAGAASVNVGAGNVTLSDTDGASNQARCMIIGVSGTPGVSRNIVAPNRSKAYVVANGSNASVVLKTSTSTGLTIPSGEVYMCYYDTGVSDFVYVGQSATSANTANKLVLRDASGNFSAGTITANLTGNVTGQLDGSITSATTAVTQAVADDSTKVATTAFVQDVIAAAVALLGTMASQNANNVNITGGSITGITDLLVADGGTGVSSLTANNVILGNGTSPVQFVAPGTSGNVLTSNGTTWTSTAPAASGLTLLTTINTTSGSSQTSATINLTGYKQVQFIFNKVSATGTSAYLRLVDPNATNLQVAQFSTSSGSNSLVGIMTLDLGTGVYSSNPFRGVASAADGGESQPFGGVSTYSTSSTAFTFNISGGNFDAGSILVYGIS